jgi:hypothetical protein
MLKTLCVTTADRSNRTIQNTIVVEVVTDLRTERCVFATICGSVRWILR